MIRTIVRPTCIRSSRNSSLKWTQEPGRTIIGAAMAVISLAISGSLLFLAQRDIPALIERQSAVCPLCVSPAAGQESAIKLDEMRQTVDEKLQTTLENRLGESFNRVVEQLARVHEGLGEMKSLASNVGDLKNVLTNVKVRGTFGEVQLELLLEQFLAPDQYIKNAQVRENSYAGPLRTAR